MFVDEWRSHEDTQELSALLNRCDKTGPDEPEEEDETASCGSEQLDDEDESSDNDNDNGSDNDDDDDDDGSDEVSFATLSSRNPFELLTDDS